MDRNQPSRDKHQSGDVLNRAVDAELAKFASVEPRPGLEDRILANLRASQTQASPHAWWRWSLAAALAVAAVIVIVVKLNSAKPSQPAIAHQSPVSTKVQKQQELEVARHDDQLMPIPHHSISRKKSSNLGKSVPVVVAGPKLDKFPSPQPLSEQERLLATYVAHFGDEAVMVARTRAEDLREELEKEGQETQPDTNHDLQAQ